MTVRYVSEGHGMTPLPTIPEGSIDVDCIISSTDKKSRVRFTETARLQQTVRRVLQGESPEEHRLRIERSDLARIQADVKIAEAKFQAESKTEIAKFQAKFQAMRLAINGESPEEHRLRVQRADIETARFQDVRQVLQGESPEEYRLRVERDDIETRRIQHVLQKLYGESNENYHLRVEIALESPKQMSLRLTRSFAGTCI